MHIFLSVFVKVSLLTHEVKCTSFSHGRIRQRLWALLCCLEGNKTIRMKKHSQRMVILALNCITAASGAIRWNTG